MSKYDSNEVIGRFGALKSAAFQFAKPNEFNHIRESRELDLHKAALAYAAAWAKVARAGRK